MTSKRYLVISIYNELAIPVDMVDEVLSRCKVVESEYKEDSKYEYTEHEFSADAKVISGEEFLPKLAT